MARKPLALLLALTLLASTVTVAGVAGATTQETASVSFSGGTSGGYTVTVDSVTLPEGGFVTIHDSSLMDGNALGSVVGTSTYLSPGTHENVTVRLSEPISESGTYVAMAHRDTNGNHVYEFVSANGQADGPYTADGQAVVDSASVTVSASVRMSDQPTDGTSVVVDRVELSSPGFVVIHDETLLSEGDATGSVVGHTKLLSAGVHTNVRIDLDANVSAQTLVAMPHVDANGNGAYDFPDGDAPFETAAGKPVVDAASVTTPDEASVTFDAQSSGGHAVTVDSVFLPQGGFVVVHDERLAQGEPVESVRGASAYLEPGLHRNVRITLSTAATEDLTLTAMAHKDTDGDMAYDFPDADGPYTANGGPVVDKGDVVTSASVTMDVQESDGHTVVVRDVDLSSGGFVVIHDSSLFAGDATGSVVGHSDYLEAGHYDNLTITLSTAVNESQVLVAMPHRDTNNDTAYDFPDADAPYTYDGGAVVSPAKVLVTASVTVTDQSSATGDTLVVDSVTLQNGGFVTIHDASLADGNPFSSVRGTSAYLSPGTHEDVEIDLSKPLGADQTVVAMAHRDTNGNQAYDFVSSEGDADGPYVAAGTAVTSKANVDVESTPTATPTPEPMTDTPMATESPTATDGMGGDTTATDTPGFGVVVAVLALLAAALVARRRR